MVGQVFLLHCCWELLGECYRENLCWGSLLPVTVLKGIFLSEGWMDGSGCPVHSAGGNLWGERQG